jgi:hypothetical protein
VNGPLTKAGLRVCTSECATCVYRPGNVMHLQPGRLKGMVADALGNDSFIVCHKTLDGERAVCRGFYDAHGWATLGCRLGHLLGVIEVTPPT